MAEIISALAVAFISGSLEAWLMNRLADDKLSETQTSHIFIVGKRITLLAMALGGLAGAIAGYRQLGIPWAMVAAGFAVTVVVAWFVLDESATPASWDKKDKTYRRWQWETVTHGYRLSLRSGVLSLLLLNAFLISLALASPKIFRYLFSNPIFKKICSSWGICGYALWESSF